ncbi:MAG: sensor histidine kinase [Paracraurococcus sp.]
MTRSATSTILPDAGAGAPGLLPPAWAAGALFAALKRGEEPDDVLAQWPAALLALVPADGMAMLRDGQAASAGVIPSAESLAALTEWLGPPPQDGILAIDRLPPAAATDGRLLAITLPGRAPGWILWLRPPAAAPWAEEDRRAALTLRAAWLEASLLRAESLAAERQAALSHQTFLMAELDHRLKNILANIQALLRHSRRRATSLDGFVGDFEARLHAMATAHDLLHASRWEGARLRPLIDEELRPHADGAARGRIAAAGPDLVLRPRAALALSLAVHELATNAAKYGALSVPEGRLALRWRRTRAGLTMVWEERGGPPAVSPTRRGFGLTVIERSLAYELGGTGQLEFGTPGLRCTICIPAAHIAPVG